MVLPGGADTGPDGFGEWDASRTRGTSQPRNTIAPLEAQQLFLKYLPVIDSVTANISRHHLRADQREEFSSSVRLKLLENDAEILRHHTGTGSGAAFLRVVIARLLYDFRCDQWGRWRPSAAARRHGPLGILLDTLLNRDGLGIDEAIETARTNHGVRVSASNLYDMCEMLAQRPMRYRSVPEDEARDVASGDPTPDLVLVGRERTAQRARLLDGLAHARSCLGYQEQLILKMRLDEGLPVSRIASGLGLDQKRLYKTLTRLYAKLRERLCARGISSEDVDECLGNPE
jgi:RNA polymerase sigma factor (sigma-70 family)